jgi:hypothetical protein
MSKKKKKQTSDFDYFPSQWKTLKSYSKLRASLAKKKTEIVLKNAAGLVLKKKKNTL